MTSRTATSLALLLVLAACSKQQADDRALVNRDPAVAGALSDPIMTDPDLAGQNQGNAALAGGGPATGEIPPEKRSQDAIDAARADALTVLGGNKSAVPTAQGQDASSPAAGAATAVALAQALPFAAPCAGKLSYGALWAAKLPPKLPVYPRAHVREAAGVDDAACHVRVVRFLTPVDPGDVLDFYYSAASAAGLPALHRRAGQDDLLGGARGAGNWQLFVRKRADGLTEAELVTAGL